MKWELFSVAAGNVKLQRYPKNSCTISYNANFVLTLSLNHSVPRHLGHKNIYLENNLRTASMYALCTISQE